MKPLTLSLLLLIAIINLASAQHPTYNVDQLGTAWTKFTADPTSANALGVYNLLPEEGHVQKEDMDMELQNGIYNTLGILEKQIRTGNRGSMKLAFRLFTISDGAFTESLQEILGNSIKTQAQPFLVELNKHRNIIGNDLSGLLCNYGESFVDHHDWQVKETSKRIQRLEKVKEKELNKLRDECIAILEEHMKSLEQTQ